MTELKTGIFDGMSFADYCAIPAANKSGLDIIADESPAHFYERQLKPDREPQKETPAKKLGSAIHCAILEPERFEEQYRLIPEPEQYPGSLNTLEQYKERCKLLGLKISGTKADLKSRLYDAYGSPVPNGTPSLQFFDDIEEQFFKGGFKSLSANDLVIVKNIREKVKNSETVKLILGSSFKTERTMIWKDPEFGVYCKARLDCTSETDPTWIKLIDFKSAETASSRGFRKAAAEYHLKRQAAWYIDGWRVLTGVSPSFVFPVYEKKPPWAHAFFVATEKFIEKGREQNRKLLAIYAECVSTGIWPGYPDELQELNLMPWEESDKDKESAVY